MCPFLNLCWDGNGYTYATNKEPKKKAFVVNGKGINQAVGIQVTIMLEIKLQKFIF